MQLRLFCIICILLSVVLQIIPMADATGAAGFMGLCLSLGTRPITVS
jgi:hypothetical protein